MEVTKLFEKAKKEYEEEWTPVTSLTSDEALCVVELLKEKGIPAKLGPTVWLPFVGSVSEVKVRRKDIERAYKIVDEYESLPRNVRKRFFEGCKREFEKKFAEVVTVK